MSTPDPTTEVNVTNNTGSQTPIVIMMPTVSTTADANGTLVYGQTLELLSAVDGTTSIPNGVTETFVLDQTFTDPDTGQTEYSTIYDLLPCTANWYSPVADLPVLQSLDDPPAYPAQTVTAADAQSFKDAASFIQAVSAYPSSQLASDYQAALNSAQTGASSSADGSDGSSGAVAQSIDDTVNAFFQTTKNYQDVTLAAVVAVQSYYDMFPFVWAQYQTSTVTYYLYSSNGSATSFVGTISLTPPSALNVAVANAGYTCTFTPASNGSDTTKVDVDTSAAKPLTYTGGLFVDDVNSDLPEIAIRGTFQIQSVFTTKPADTQIITVLTGTIDGQTCIGFDSPQLSSDTSSTFWDTLFHPKNSAQIFQSVMTIGGAVMMLMFFGGIVLAIGKWARSFRSKPMSLDQLSAENAKQMQALNEKIDALTKALTNGKGEAPASASDALNVAKQQTDIVNANEAAPRLQTALNAEAKTAETAAQFEEVYTRPELVQLQESASMISKGSRDLSTTPTTELGPVVTEVTPQVGVVNTNLGQLTTSVSSRMSQAEKTEIASNAQLVEEVQTQVEDITKNASDGEGSDLDTDTLEVPDA